MHAVAVNTVVALLVVACAGSTSPVSAEEAAAPAAGAPAAPVPAPQNPLPGTKPDDAPAAEPDATKDIQGCLVETGDFVSHGKANTYLIGIENKCPQRLRCVIDAYITGAKGPVSVHTVMTLDAKAKKTYTAKVKTAGGTAQVSRDCKID
jgi:hypothetical protein